MKKTIKNRFGEELQTKELELYYNDENNLTLQKGTLIIYKFDSIDEAVDFLDLTEEEEKKLEENCCL